MELHAAERPRPAERDHARAGPAVCARRVRRAGAIVPITPLTPARPGESIENISVRYRTVGDITCTAPVESVADTISKIVIETASTTITERGATRLDDQTSDASMELRKKEGYF